MGDMNTTSKGLGIHARRLIAHIVLIFLTFLCLFWFYVLFVNATRSNSDLTRGFTPWFGDHMAENWTNLINGTLPVFRGLFNSLLVSGCSAVLCTYFSSMTAYAIHAYDFK